MADREERLKRPTPYAGNRARRNAGCASSQKASRGERFAADRSAPDHRTLAPPLQRSPPAFEPRLSHAERVRVTTSKRSFPSCNGPSKGQMEQARGAVSSQPWSEKTGQVSGGGMRFLVLLFLALFPAEPSHAREAPNLAFVSEYIRELAVNERMRALGERELTDVGGNNQFAALIRSSTKIRMELGAQIHTLSGIHLEPPFEGLTAKITKFYNMKIEFHQRLIAISTSLCHDHSRVLIMGRLLLRFLKSLLLWNISTVRCSKPLP